MRAYTRPPKSAVDRRTPDERCTVSFPKKLRDLELGWRLDALDGQGGWFAATVVEVMLVLYSIRLDWIMWCKQDAMLLDRPIVSRATFVLFCLFFSCPCADMTC